MTQLFTCIFCGRSGQNMSAVSGVGPPQDGNFWICSQCGFLHRVTLVGGKFTNTVLEPSDFARLTSDSDVGFLFSLSILCRAAYNASKSITSRVEALASELGT